MKNLVHEILTDLKFLYPCIPYEEILNEKELTITSETKLSRLYPVKMTVEGMESLGEDFWGNYLFKDEAGAYYCELEGELYYKGNDPEGEPRHLIKDKKIIVITPEIDSEVSEFKPYLEKIKEYFKNKADVDLLDLKVSVDNPEDRKNGKIICLMKLKRKEPDSMKMNYNKMGKAGRGEKIHLIYSGINVSGISYAGTYCGADFSNGSGRGRLSSRLLDLDQSKITCSKCLKYFK